MNRAAVAFFGACLLGPAPSAAQVRRGIVSGRVRAQPRVEARTAAAGGAYSSRELRYASLFDYRHLKNVIVYALPSDSSTAIMEAPAPAEVHVREGRAHDLRLEPAFLVVREGQALRFHNETGETVTVYSGGGSPAFLSAPLGPREEKTVVPGAQGLYELACLCGAGEIRAGSKVFVAGPYFVPADSEGRYELELPPGRYRENDRGAAGSTSMIIRDQAPPGSRLRSRSASPRETAIPRLDLAATKCLS